MSIKIKINAILLISITIVPFLIPVSYFPINKFFSEIFSILSALIVVLLFIFNSTQIKISAVTVACFMFAIFAIMQPIFVDITLFSINLYLFLLFTILGLFSLAITTLVNDNPITREYILEIICWGLLISGVLQALIGYVQFLGHEADFQGWILQSSYNDGTGSNIFGNLGQRNQYIDLLSTCALAVVYLLYKNKINYITATILFLIYNIAITFCAGRTVFLYFLFTIIVCVIILMCYKKDKVKFFQYKKITLLIIFYLALLILTELTIPILLSLFQGTADIPTGIKRLSSAYVGQSTYRRFYEWYKALMIFIQHPIIGIGWFQYPKEAIYMMLDQAFYYIPANKRLYTHCHNSLLNIMAETGIIGTFITIGYGIIYSLYRALKHCDDGLIIMALSSPVLIHSFFEYPLWYSYFLIILILLLSFSDPIYVFKKVTLVHKAVLTIITLLLFTMCINYCNQALQILTITAIPENAAAKSANIKSLETIIISKYNIFNYSALLALDSYMPQSIYSITLLQEDLQFINLLGNIAPFPSAIYKQMIVYHLLGNEELAVYYANLLTHAYPALQQEFIAQMNACTNCTALTSTISAFSYEDKSLFAKWFDAIHHQQSY
jgi:O-antigen ligase